jgi:hypothetical protein
MQLLCNTNFETACVCVGVCVCVCVCVYMYVCMYVCMHVYVYIYPHTHTHTSRTELCGDSTDDVYSRGPEFKCRPAVWTRSRALSL